jgi:hypothetical protein
LRCADAAQALVEIDLERRTAYQRRRQGRREIAEIFE